MFEEVTWANKQDLSPERWQKMARRAAHLQAELEAVTIATFGPLTAVRVWSSFYDVAIRVGSVTALSIEDLLSGTHDYALLNGSIATIAPGQATLYFDSIVAKFWRPEDVNYLSAWFRATKTSPSTINVDYATFIIHRTPMAV